MLQKFCNKVIFLSVLRIYRMFFKRLEKKKANHITALTGFAIHINYYIIQCKLISYLVLKTYYVFVYFFHKKYL